MKLTFKKLVREGEHFPRFYGGAYIDFAGMQMACYPIPFNHIVAWWHISVMPRLRGPLYVESERIREMQSVERAAREKGFQEGRRNFADVEDFLRRIDEDECLAIFPALRDRVEQRIKDVIRGAKISRAL
jgi:hypothetical protein